jgi:hypothetical protein
MGESMGGSPQSRRGRWVLWIVDEIHTNRLGTAAILHAALLVLEQDTTVRLPARELSAFIKRYDRLR